MKYKLATLAFALSLSSSAAFAQTAPGAACQTTGRFPHSIEQHCNDNSMQEVFFDQPGKVVIDNYEGQSADPRETVGQYAGPWLIWTDYNGAICATGAVVSMKDDFYPSTCPPDGVPAAD